MNEGSGAQIAPARPPNLMPAAVVVFAIWVLAAVLANRALYADGAHEFIRVLQSRDFVSLMWSRHFAFYIYEFPLVLAIKCGVTHLPLLRLAFGVGCFLPWPLALLACHWISPQNFWLALTGCAAGYLNAAYMAVGEHILAHALFWPALFVILFARPLKPLAAAILLISATGLLYCYESQSLLCLPLAALCLRRLVQDSRNQPPAACRRSWQWPVWLAGTGLFLVASGLGWFAVLHPEIPENYGGFLDNTAAMIRHPGWTLAWTLGWGGLTLAACVSDNIWGGLGRRPGLILLTGALAIWAAWPLLAPARLEPARQYDNRILDLLVPLLLLPLALWLDQRAPWLTNKSARLAWFAAALLIVQSSWQLAATWQWHQDLKKLQAILEAHQGLVPLRTTVLGQSSIESRNSEFDWTWPCLSLAISPGPHIQSLVCSELYIDLTGRGKAWQPFNPLRMETLPDLRHYGLDFDEYARALRREAQGPDPAPLRQ